MRGLWRRLFRLSLLCTFLMGLALPAAALAEENLKPTLQVEAGFEGRAKSGQWIPITVQITNPGPELSGHLEYDSRIELGPNRQLSTYKYPVVVSAGATKRLSFLMPASLSTIPLVRLMTGGETVAIVQPQLEITWDILIGVLGVEPAEVAPLSGMKFGQRTSRLVRLTADTLPADPLALANLDAILLDRAAWAELPAPQQQALRAWVEHGGVLIAGGGPEVKRLEPLFPWMGLSLQGQGRQNLEGIGAADLARIDETGWRVTRRSGEHLLSAYRAKGAGKIHFLAFDPALEPFASWAGLPALLGDLISQGSNLAIMPGGQGGPTAAKTGMMLIDMLGQIPVKEIPSTRRLLYLLGIYALLIGPVHLLLLRGFRRLGWALLTLPLLSVAGAGTAWAYMEANRGADVNAVSLAVVEGQPGGTSLMVRSLTGFYLPPGVQYEGAMGEALLTPVPSPGIAMPGMPYQPADLKTSVAEGRRAILGGQERWQMQAVGAEAAVPVASTVAADLMVDGFHVTGTVTNHLPFAVTDAMIVVGSNFQRLGAIEPGQTIDVSVMMPAGQAQQMGPNRIAEAMARSLDVGMIGPGGPTAQQQEQMRRQQLSWGLSNTLPWAESMEQPKVILAGWMENSVLPVQMGGHELEATATTLYVQRLEYRFSTGELFLPPDFVESRLVESSAGMNGPLQWGWGMAKGGFVTIEQTVPAEVAGRVTEMELRIPILDKGPTVGELPMTLKLFRWSDATWVDTPYEMSGVTLRAADGFLSSEGRVRIQIGKTTDAPLIFGAPGLTVHGKGVSR